MKKYTFDINGNTFNVVINSVSGDAANVTVNGVNYHVDMLNNATTGVQPASVEHTVPVQTAPQSVSTPVQSAAPSGAGKAVKSPLPGVILSVNVNVGDAVKAGQVVAVLEAMKMENEIQAESDGTVTAINVAKGDSVLEGAPIVTLG